MDKLVNPSEQYPKAQTGAQSIYRTVSLIRAVAENNMQGSRLSQIAKMVSLHAATARRILSVLVSEGLITFEPTSKLYHLGMEMYHLGNQAQQFHVLDIFRPIVEQIALETEDTVFLLVRSGYDVLCVDLIQGKFPIRTIDMGVGDRYPLGISAGSLAIIAFLVEKEFDQILKANEPRYEQNYGITVAEIRALAARSQKTGYIVSKGLFLEGVTSIGIPINHKKGNLAVAITVSAINKRLDNGRQKQIVQYVKKLVDQYNI